MSGLPFLPAGLNVNYLAMVITVYAALALEVTLGSAVSLGGLEPSLLLIVLVFVSIQATADRAMKVALVLGVLADLFHSPLAGAVIVGPMTLGFVVGAYAVTQLRNTLFRGSIVTLAAMVLAGGFFAELVSVTIWSLRGTRIAGDAPEGWLPIAELGWRTLGVLYSALWSLAVGWVLLRFRGWYRFGVEHRWDAM